MSSCTGTPPDLEVAGDFRAMNSRVATYRLFHPVDLSIVLSKNVVADAEKLLSRRICIVTMESPTLVRISSNRFCRRRKARFAARRKWLNGEIPDSSELSRAGDDPQLIKFYTLPIA